MSSNFVSVAFPMGESLSESDIEEVYNTAMDTGGLDFSGADLSGDQPYFIADLLSSNKMISIVHIDLSHTKTTIEGFEAILFAAMEIKSLESFVAKSLNLPKEAGMSLSKLIASKGCLKILDVSCNDLGDVGLSNLSGAFSADHSKVMTKQLLSVVTISVLDLSNNNLGDAGVLALCRGLSQFVRRAVTVGVTPALKVLKLNNNNVTDKAAICLAQLLNYRDSALSPSPKAGFSNSLHLDELGLNDNPLTSRGINALLGSVAEGVLSPLKRLYLANTGVDIEVLSILAQSIRGDTSLVQVDLSCSAPGAAELVHGSGSVSVAGVGTTTLFTALNQLCSAIVHTNTHLSLSLGFLHRTLYTQGVYLTRANSTYSAEIVRTLEACNHPSVCAALGLVVVPNVTHWLRSAEYAYSVYSAAYSEAVELCVEEASRAKHSGGKWQSNPMRETGSTGGVTVGDSTIYTPTTTTTQLNTTLTTTDTTASATEESSSLEAVLKQDARSLLSALRGLSPEGKAALNVPVIGSGGSGGSSGVDGGSIGNTQSPLPLPPPVASTAQTLAPLAPPAPAVAAVVPSPVKKSHFLSSFHGGVLGVLSSADITATAATSAVSSIGGNGVSSVVSPNTTVTPIMTLPSTAPNTTYTNKPSGGVFSSGDSNTTTPLRHGAISVSASALNEAEFKQLSAERTTALRHLSEEIDRLAHVSPSPTTAAVQRSLSPHTHSAAQYSGAGGDSGSYSDDVYGGVYSPVYSAEYTPVKSSSSAVHTPAPTVPTPPAHTPLTPFVHTYSPDGDLYSIYTSPPVHTTTHTNPMSSAVFKSRSSDSVERDVLVHAVADNTNTTLTITVINTEETSSTANTTNTITSTVPFPTITHTPTIAPAITTIPTAATVSTTASSVDASLVQIIGYLQARLHTLEQGQALYESSVTNKFSALECRVEAVEAMLRTNSDALSAVQQGQDRILELLNNRSGGSGGNGSDDAEVEHNVNVGSSGAHDEIALTTVAPSTNATTPHPHPHEYIPNELLVTDLLARLELVEGRLLGDRATALQAVLARQLHSEREIQRQELTGGTVSSSVLGGGVSPLGVRSPQFVGSVSSVHGTSGGTGAAVYSPYKAVAQPSGSVYSAVHQPPLPVPATPYAPYVPNTTTDTNTYTSDSNSVYNDAVSTVPFVPKQSVFSSAEILNRAPQHSTSNTTTYPTSTTSTYPDNNANSNTNNNADGNSNVNTGYIPQQYGGNVHSNTAHTNTTYANTAYSEEGPYSTPYAPYAAVHTQESAPLPPSALPAPHPTPHSASSQYVPHVHTTTNSEWTESLENLAQYDPQYEEKYDYQQSAAGFEPSTQQSAYSEPVHSDYEVQSQLTNYDSGGGESHSNTDYHYHSSNGGYSENASVSEYEDVVMHTPYRTDTASANNVYNTNNTTNYPADVPNGRYMPNTYNTNSSTNTTNNTNHNVNTNNVQSDRTVSNQRQYSGTSSGNIGVVTSGSVGGGSGGAAEPLSRAAAAFQRLQSDRPSARDSGSTSTAQQTRPPTGLPSTTYTNNSSSTTNTTSNTTHNTTGRSSVPARSVSNPRGRFASANSSGAASGGSIGASGRGGAGNTRNDTTTSTSNSNNNSSNSKVAASPYIAAHYYSFDALDTPLVTLDDHGSDREHTTSNNINTNNVHSANANTHTDYNRLISARDNNNLDSSLNYSVINNLSRTSLSLADDTLNDSVSLLGQDVQVGRSGYSTQYQPNIVRTNNVTYTTQNNTINTFHTNHNSNNNTTNTINASKGRAKSPHFVRPTASNAIKAASHRPAPSAGVEHR